MPVDIFVLERSDLGVLPDQIMSIMDRVEYFSKASPGSKNCVIAREELGTASDVVEIYASHIKSPTSLISDRLVIDAKYLVPQEHIVMMSSKGNDAQRDEYY